MEITDRLLAIEQGAGTDDDLAEINARLRTVTDANRCYLGTEEQNVVSSILRAFPDAFAARLEGSAGPLVPRSSRSSRTSSTTAPSSTTSDTCASARTGRTPSWFRRPGS